MCLLADLSVLDFVLVLEIFLQFRVVGKFNFTTFFFFFIANLFLLEILIVVFKSLATFLESTFCLGFSSETTLDSFLTSFFLFPSKPIYF